MNIFSYFFFIDRLYLNRVAWKKFIPKFTLGLWIQWLIYISSTVWIIHFISLAIYCSYYRFLQLIPHWWTWMNYFIVSIKKMLCFTLMSTSVPGPTCNCKWWAWRSTTRKSSSSMLYRRALSNWHQLSSNCSFPTETTSRLTVRLRFWTSILIRWSDTSKYNAYIPNQPIWLVIDYINHMRRRWNSST